MKINSVVDNIFTLFARDNSLGYYTNYDPKRKGWHCTLHIPKTAKILNFILLDSDALDIKYISDLNDKLYDTLKERLEEAE